MKLSEAMKAEFSLSKISWALVLVLQVVAILIAIASIGRSGWALPALLSGALVPIISAIVKRRGAASYDRGEKLRRLMVMSEGLGRAPSQVELAIAAASVPSLKSFDPDPVGSYYSSSKPEGPARLAQIVAESAMFTSRLARTSQLACSVAVVGGLIAAVILLFAFVAQPAGTPIDAERAAQAASMVLAFGFTTEFVGLMFGYSDLAERAGRSLETCGRLAENDDVELDDVRSAVAEYDLALAKAPPLSGLIYRIQRTFLDRSWTVLSNPRDQGVKPSGPQPPPAM